MTSSPDRFRITIVLALIVGLVFAPQTRAQAGGSLGDGWVLDPDASELRFLSIKKGEFVESNRFTTISGVIARQGLAKIRILLDSVDTSVDLRNVRMRFLFFETFLHPEATVTAQLDPAILTDLQTVRRKVIDLGYALSLHGMTVSKTARVAVTLIDNDRVVVSSAAPIDLTLSEFDLEAGLRKLEEAASVSVTPVAIVSFEFAFIRSGADDASLTRPAGEADASATVATGTGGDPDRAACVRDLKARSDSGEIGFAPSSDRLTDSSKPVLDEVFTILSRCTNLIVQVAGHTDSDGNARWNRQLSQKRAAAVAAYLSARGIASDRLQVIGYGETAPLVANTSPQNKARNRRIEFSVVN